MLILEMRANAKINFNEKIAYLSILSDGSLAIVDMANNFSVTDLVSLDKSFEISLKKAYVHIQKQSISFSLDGKYLAFAEKEQSVVRVVNIQTHKLHHSYPTHNNNVETLCFDPSSSYLVAGCVTGRVFLWSLFSTGSISRLSSFPEYSASFTQPKVNYVSYACFSPSGSLVATTGYGGSIVITDIHTEVSPKRITPKHVRVNAMSFVGEDFLCAGNIEGGIDFIDLSTSQILKHFGTGLGAISSFCVSKSLSYVLVSGSSKSVVLIDLKEKKVVDKDYIRLNSKVTRMDINSKDQLFIGCENGSVNMYDLFPQEMLQLRIKTSAFVKAYELILNYPLLKESDLTQKIEEAWQKSFEQSIKYVEEKKYEEALTNLRKFVSVYSKQDTVQEFKTLISHYERFKLAVKHENFALAYSMADNVPLLKDTSSYKEMEEIWNNAFLKAQAYLVRDKTHELFKVLEPFNKVTSKLCFIQVLVRQPELFLEFVSLINIHKYDKIFQIAHRYPCLKEISLYKNIVDSVDTIYESSKENIFLRKYDKVKEQMQELSHIPFMKTKFEELSHILSFATRLEHLYEEDDINSCYALIDKHEILKKSELSKILEKIWLQKMKACEKNALLGHTKEIKKILGGLINITTRSQKIGMLLRFSFLTQIKYIIIKKQFDILQEAFDNYINMFSYDTELDNLVIKLEKDKIMDIKLSEEQKLRRTRSLWLNTTKGIIPDNIVGENKNA